MGPGQSIAVLYPPSPGSTPATLSNSRYCLTFTHETMEDQKLDKTVEQTIAILSETFMPAVSLDDSAKRYTSVQVAQAIYDLTGTSPSIDLIYQVMQDYGYRYVVDETSATLKYVWLMKYRR